MTVKAAPLGIIGDYNDWPVVDSAGGPLVKIEIRPRVFVKMREAEARRRGLLPEEKAQPPAPNKARRGARNKAKPADAAGAE